MRPRTGVLPNDFKNLSRMKMNSENLKELARTILAAIVMLIAVSLCFLAAVTTPEPTTVQDPVTRKGGGWLDGSHTVTARRQSNP